jgi:UDP-GlcNAc:undecaprenyl-phosphate/decaprenyl-phosphate GlcNAc-1-phosphate transferase
MNLHFFSIISAMAITSISIILLRPIALNIKLTDRPGARKLHTGSVPLIGGIAMFLGVVLTIVLVADDYNYYKFFLLSSLALVLIGALDDRFDISIFIRLLVQISVGTMIIAGANLNIISFGNLFGAGEILLNNWSYVITVLAIIAGINAVNMADGIHGLAGGNSLITFLTILFLIREELNYQGFIIALTFCAALIIFLVHNLRLGLSEDKRIFMGDAGSMFLGMGIAWLLIDFSQGEDKAFRPSTALWIFAAPIFDLTLAIIRRLADGKSPFKPDVFHTHHLLLRMGIKDKKVLLTVLLFSIFMAVTGVIGELFDFPEWVMFNGFIMVFIVYLLLCRLAIRKIHNNSVN